MVEASLPVWFDRRLTGAVGRRGQLATEPSPDTYPVWCSATGMQAAWDDVVDEGEPAQDCHLLQIWPALIATDRIVKQTSRAAAYWHTVRKAHG